MKKPYRFYKFIHCKIIVDRCLRQDETFRINDQTKKPDCDLCDIYKDWKEAGG